MEKDNVIVIRADKQSKTRLAKIAKESNRTMSDYIRLLIDYASQHKIKL